MGVRWQSAILTCSLPWCWWCGGVNQLFRFVVAGGTDELWYLVTNDFPTTALRGPRNIGAFGTCQVILRFFCVFDSSMSLRFTLVWFGTNLASYQ
jgi:hypothetical protein